MSRSRNKTPITGIASIGSDRAWKRHGHRSYRQAERQALIHGRDVPDRRTVMNAYNSDKDGKQWLADGLRSPLCRK